MRVNFKKTNFEGLFVLEPKVFKDDRGYFFESFKQQELNDICDKNISFIQENESKSSFGTLRGLHYQEGAFAQTKLVRVVSGKVLDVVLDLRAGSDTFGQTYSIILDDENKNQLLIPKGFAHGFITLSEEAIFSYKVDENYSPENENGIKYNDPTLAINWMISKEQLIISDKDLIHPEFGHRKHYF